MAIGSSRDSEPHRGKTGSSTHPRRDCTPVVNPRAGSARYETSLEPLLEAGELEQRIEDQTGRRKERGLFFTSCSAASSAVVIQMRRVSWLGPFACLRKYRSTSCSRRARSFAAWSSTRRPPRGCARRSAPVRRSELTFGSTASGSSNSSASVRWPRFARKTRCVSLQVMQKGDKWNRRALHGWGAKLQADAPRSRRPS
jgi:hypothetical protein